MRYIFRIIPLFLFPVISCSAQSGFQNDTIIANLSHNIPKGWIVKVQDSCLYIIRTKPIYRTLANHMNGPADFEKKPITTDNDIPPAGSVKDTMELVYKLSKRWSDEKYQEIKRNNDHYYVESDRVHFSRKKGGTTFVPHGKDSSTTVHGDPKIDAYNDSISREVSRIDRQIIRPPEECTQLYFLEYVWLKKDNAPYPMSYDIFPDQANIELDKIRGYISSNCSCYELYEHK